MAKKVRSCELCSSDARMFCESDQARLCWDCDEKVHAANFLVAKHIRTALCHVCHCQTPWKASGPMLGRTVSVCGVCVARSARRRGGSGESEGVLAVEEEAAPLDGSEDEDEDDDDEYESDEEIGCSDDDDDENQVVPWTSNPPSPPPASTSCSEEEDSCSSSRFRDLPSEIGARGLRSRAVSEEVDGDITGDGFGRPLKYRRVKAESKQRFDDFSR